MIRAAPDPELGERARPSGVFLAGVSSSPLPAHSFAPTDGCRPPVGRRGAGRVQSLRVPRSPRQLLHRGASSSSLHAQLYAARGGISVGKRAPGRGVLAHYSHPAARARPSTVGIFIPLAYGYSCQSLGPAPLSGSLHQCQECMTASSPHRDDPSVRGSFIEVQVSDEEHQLTRTYSRSSPSHDKGTRILPRPR